MYPIVYVHIPKTAGTSLRIMLEDYAGAEGLFSAYPEAGPPHRAVTDWSSLSREEREKVRVVTGHYHFGAFDRYIDAGHKYFLTFLREPVDRIISLYKHLMAAHEKYKENPESLMKFCFEQPLQEIAEQIDNHQTRMIAGVPAKRQVTEKDMYEAQRIIESSFFFVGTTENFEEDTKRLAQCINAEKFYTKKENESLDRRSREYYSKSEISLVEHANRYDVELYRYVSQNRERLQKPIDV